MEISNFNSKEKHMARNCIICMKEYDSKNRDGEANNNSITCSKICSGAYRRVYMYLGIRFRSKLKNWRGSIKKMREVADVLEEMSNSIK